jgi:hypothetical protein
VGGREHMEICRRPLFRRRHRSQHPLPLPRSSPPPPLSLAFPPSTFRSAFNVCIRIPRPPFSPKRPTKLRPRAPSAPAPLRTGVCLWLAAFAISSPLQRPADLQALHRHAGLKILQKETYSCGSWGPNYWVCSQGGAIFSQGGEGRGPPMDINKPPRRHGAFSPNSISPP